MKKILTVALAATTIATATAQVVRIETEKGTKVYNLSDIKSISFSDEQNTEELATIEMINANALSFDLKVTKSPSCAKYIVAVQPKNTYQESDFVFAAEQTLDRNAFYRPYLSTLSYEDGVFSEAELGLNTLTDDSGKALDLVAAIYAVDDLGRVQITTKDLKVPTNKDVTSNVKMKIEVNNITFDRVDYTVSPQGWYGPAKIIYGVAEPAGLKTTAAAFKAKSEQQQREFLLDNAMGGVPQAYKTRITGTHNTSANTCVIIFALPIDSEGKIGEMAIKVVDTPVLSFTGTGSFTSCTPVEQTDWDAISFNIGVDENTVAYRLMFVSKTEDTNSDYTKSKLPEIFLLSKYQDYGICREFPATETTATIELYRSDTYILYGATVDRDGNVSKPVDLLKTYTGSATIKTMEK